MDFVVKGVRFVKYEQQLRDRVKGVDFSIKW